MKGKILFVTIAILLLGGVIYRLKAPAVEVPAVDGEKQAANFPDSSAAIQAEQRDNGQSQVGEKQGGENMAVVLSSQWQAPLTRAAERITKKPFGMFVAPQNSPVSPERFRGYHTGTDFEAFPEEADAEVAVKAACSGELKMKTIASGYGGVAVQSCNLEEGPVTVIYGHLNLFSVAKNIGEIITAGEELGFLGKGFSSETGGERKHLHFGIHGGAEINILGYVQQRAELSAWLDPCWYVCEK